MFCRERWWRSISTHAPLAGRDLDCHTLPTTTLHFNPRAPCGARPSTPSDSSRPFHFNPRAPCGARRFPLRPSGSSLSISTHAPLAGRDRVNAFIFRHILEFQPTRPLRGATFSIATVRQQPFDFNPRAPCGARPCQCVHLPAYPRISTHAPLAGRDGAVAGAGGY